MNKLFAALFTLCSSGILIHAQETKLWSILICTLEERAQSFERIYSKLQNQIHEYHLEDEVEVLFFKDNREHSIGFKRNALLNQSQAEYISFVDDDDDVHDLYVPLIYRQLLKKPDCVSLMGIMTTCGQNPEMFIHSINYNDKYCTKNNMHFRPPNHLNPVKRLLASQCAFPDSNFGKDYEWAMKIAAAGLLNNEATLLVPYYFYLYDCTKYDVKKIEADASSPSGTASFPLVSIITSVYKSDEFITQFLEHMVKDPFFPRCELIIINANSPGNEEPIITEYCKKYPNIIYERLPADPGLYAVWNYAIKKARARYVTNLNTDDRRWPGSLERDYEYLERHPEIDLVYSDFYWCFEPNRTSETLPTSTHICQTIEFAPCNMWCCMPGPMPMWRKSVHEKCGFFDESYVSAGDFEFWNRMVQTGSTFQKLSGIAGIYYDNPRGLSTDKEAAKQVVRKTENDRIVQAYSSMWAR